MSDRQITPYNGQVQQQSNGSLNMQQLSLMKKEQSNSANLIVVNLPVDLIDDCTKTDFFKTGNFRKLPLQVNITGRSSQNNKKPMDQQTRQFLIDRYAARRKALGLPPEK